MARYITGRFFSEIIFLANVSASNSSHANTPSKFLNLFSTLIKNILEHNIYTHNLTIYYILVFLYMLTYTPSILYFSNIFG